MALTLSIIYTISSNLMLLFLKVTYVENAITQHLHLKLWHAVSFNQSFLQDSLIHKALKDCSTQWSQLYSVCLILPINLLYKCFIWHLVEIFFRIRKARIVGFLNGIYLLDKQTVGLPLSIFRHCGVQSSSLAPKSWNLQIKIIIISINKITVLHRPWATW